MTQVCSGVAAMLAPLPVAKRLRHARCAAVKKPANTPPLIARPFNLSR
ncbi:hypothetical protein G7Y82_00545 [Solimonas sp. C16B3]|uniref:Uncharacterized protein n=2 Tax=Solimonas marina TaxID=2714601 RepID=A0A970B4M5_9GAMM|nr:hypothetical protein [Solimonas marina]